MSGLEVGRRVLGLLEFLKARTRAHTHTRTHAHTHTRTQVWALRNVRNAVCEWVVDRGERGDVLPLCVSGCEWGY